MSIRFCTALFAAAIMTAALLTGCAKPQLSVPLVFDWTHRAAGAYIVDQDRVFYGIGKATGVHNLTLLRAAADNQAQEEMAGVINNYLTLLVQASGIHIEAQEEQQTLNALTQAALRSARIVDHRRDAPSNTLYSLCSLDLAEFKQILQTEPQLNNALRKEMLAQSDRVYAEFASSAP